MASGIAILLNGLIQQLEAANSGSDSALFNTGIELLRRLTGLPVMCIHITDMSCILQLLMYNTVLLPCGKKCQEHKVLHILHIQFPESGCG